MAVDALTAEEDPFCRGFPDDYRNPRGIPRMQFIEDVHAHISNFGEAGVVLRQLHERHSKYKLMEVKLTRMRMSLKVHSMPFHTCFCRKKFRRSNELFRWSKSSAQQMRNPSMPASLYPTVSTPVPESFNPLQSVCGLARIQWWNIHSKQHLRCFAKISNQLVLNWFAPPHPPPHQMVHNHRAQISVREDLAWLRDQLTVSEVNLARVWNADVATRSARPAT